MSQLGEFLKDWNSIKDIRRHVKEDLKPAQVERIVAAVEKETNYKISGDVVFAVVSWAIRLIGGK